MPNRRGNKAPRRSKQDDGEQPWFQNQRKRQRKRNKMQKASRKANRK